MAQASAGFAMLDAFLIAGLVTAIVTPVLLFAIEALKLVRMVVARISRTSARTKIRNLPLIIEETGQVFVDRASHDADTEPSDLIADLIIDGQELGVVHDIPADVSELVIPAFRPGTDSCRVWLRNAEVEYTHWTGAAGVVLAFYDAAERLSITFQGLECPPFADIETIFECVESGRQVRRLTEPGSTGPAKATSEDRDDAQWRLSAWAETERAVEAFDDPSQSVEEIQDSSALPEFSEFDPVAEIVEVWVPCSADADMDIRVVPTPDGMHGLVVVDGQPTALLQGAPNATVRNIRIVPMTAQAA